MDRSRLVVFAGIAAVALVGVANAKVTVVNKTKSPIGITTGRVNEQGFPEFVRVEVNGKATSQVTNSLRVVIGAKDTYECVVKGKTVKLTGDVQKGVKAGKVACTKLGMVVY